jgi:hypothetical protein
VNVRVGESEFVSEFEFEFVFEGGWWRAWSWRVLVKSR